MLLGISRADASTGEIPSIDDGKRDDGDLFKPLILKAAPTQIISEQLFAGHRSHSSHSSHSSGSSGGGAGHRSHASHSSHYSGTSGGGAYYVPPVQSSPTTPRYPAAASLAPPSPPAVASTPAPARRAAPGYTGGVTATPVPQQIAPSASTVTQTQTRIELANGAVIYGAILAKSAAGITFKGLDGRNYKVPRILLSTATIASLALPAEQANAAPSAPGVVR